MRDEGGEEEVKMARARLAGWLAGCEELAALLEESICVEADALHFGC